MSPSAVSSGPNGRVEWQARRLSWSVLPLSQGYALRRALYPRFQAGQESIFTGSTGSLGLLSLKTRQTNIL